MKDAGLFGNTDAPSNWQTHSQGTEDQPR
jgi:hypothetical protein